MIEKCISFGDQTIIIKYPTQATDIINFTFFDFPLGAAPDANTTIDVYHDQESQRFSVEYNSRKIGTDLNHADLSILLLSRVIYDLTYKINCGLAIHGAAVLRNGKSVLIPGCYGTGKSIFISWLLAQGYLYLTDELVYFPEDNLFFNALTTPICIKQFDLPIVEPIFEDFFSLDCPPNLSLHNTTSSLFSHRIFADKPIQDSNELSFLLFIEHQKNGVLSLDSISPAQAAQRLVGCTSNTHNLKLHGLPQVASLTRQTAALVLQYADFHQLENVLQPLIDFVLDTGCTPLSFQSIINAFDNFSIQKMQDQPTVQPTITSGEQWKTSTFSSPCFKPKVDIISKQSQQNIAILFMTHKWSLSIANRFAKLNSEIGNQADCFLLLHDDHGYVRQAWLTFLQTINKRNALKLFDTEKLTKKLGYEYLYQHKLLPGCANYPLLNFSRSAGYQFYWLIESDVEFRGNWSFLINAYQECQIDLLASHVQSYNEYPSWDWWRSIYSSTCPKIHTLGNDNLFKAFLPIYRISAEATKVLDNAYKEGWRGHSEVLVPTVLNLLGYSIGDLRSTTNCYPAGSQNPHPDREQQSTIRWLPEITPEEFICRETIPTLFHPVKQDWWFNDSKDKLYTR